MFLSRTKRRIKTDYDLLLRMIVPVLGAFLTLAAIHHEAHAASGVFVIADSEGYGIMDCLTDGKSCGRVVADAWCEAHGFGPAQSFGRASDVTGAIPVATSTAPTRIELTSAVVTCGE